MKKGLKTALIFVLALALFLTLIFALISLTADFRLTGNSILQKSSYTKAICDGNYCEDYYIECEGNNLVKISPTGFSIYTKNTQENLNEDFCS